MSSEQPEESVAKSAKKNKSKQQNYMLVSQLSDSIERAKCKFNGGWS